MCAYHLGIVVVAVITMMCATTFSPADSCTLLLCFRLKYLHKSEYGWDVSVYEVGQQGALQGPYQLTGNHADGPDATIVESLPRLKYGHFVYVCQKHACTRV